MNPELIEKLSPNLPYQHGTFSVQDPSKMEVFNRCPREYFFSYIMGLRPGRPNIHLVFGSAWHAAHEYLTDKGYTEENVEEAYDKFLQIYREAFPEHMDFDQKSYKTPDNARAALYSYIIHWAVEDKNDKNLAVEISVRMPLGKDRYFHGKIDAINQGKSGLIYGDDHKTSSKQMKYWYDQWEQRDQFLFYLHCLYSIFPREKVEGFRVNGYITTKVPKFLRHTISKTPAQMQDWADRLHHHLDLLEQEFEKLTQAKKAAPTMGCFQKNTNSCVRYQNLCPFHDLCNTFPNPLQLGNSVPGGFVKEYWDPRSKKTKNKLDPETMEVKKND